MPSSRNVSSSFGIVREAVVVQVVGGRERQPGRHDEAGDAAVAPRDHARGSLRQRAVHDEHVELAELGVVGREPRDVGADQVARARDDRAQELLEVEPARQVLRRSDDREQAALALLLQLEPVAHGHGHADRLDQGRFARIARRQRVDVGEAARELVGRRALVQHRDKVAHSLLAAVDVDRAPHARRFSSH